MKRLFSVATMLVATWAITGFAAEPARGQTDLVGHRVHCRPDLCQLLEDRLPEALIVAELEPFGSALVDHLTRCGRDVTDSETAVEPAAEAPVAAPLEDYEYDLAEYSRVYGIPLTAAPEADPQQLSAAPPSEGALVASETICRSGHDPSYDAIVYGAEVAAPPAPGAAAGLDSEAEWAAQYLAEAAAETPAAPAEPQAERAYEAQWASEYLVEAARVSPTTSPSADASPCSRGCSSLAPVNAVVAVIVESTEAEQPVAAAEMPVAESRSEVRETAPDRRTGTARPHCGDVTELDVDDLYDWDCPSVAGPAVKSVGPTSALEKHLITALAHSLHRAGDLLHGASRRLTRLAE